MDDLENSVPILTQCPHIPRLREDFGTKFGLQYVHQIQRVVGLVAVGNNAATHSTCHEKTKGAFMLMHLVPVDGGPAIPIDKPILFFGRQPECDVVLLNSRKVSRKHCCIAQIDDHFVVRDLGSMNGVRVNDKSITKECRIGAGDEVQIGDLSFRLEVRMPEKRSPLPAGIAKKPPLPKPSPAQGGRRVDPKLLSQDLPVAIPEENISFAVEESQRNIKPVKPKRQKEEDVIELDDVEVIDD